MMRCLTPDEQQMIDQLAQRYGFSAEAVLHMLQAVMNGQGTMAQFHHPEFGAITADDLIVQMTGHGIHHLPQIRSALGPHLGA